MPIFPIDPFNAMLVAIGATPPKPAPFPLPCRPEAPHAADYDADYDADRLAAERGICSVADCEYPILGWCMACGDKLCRSHLETHFRTGANVRIAVPGRYVLTVLHGGRNDRNGGEPA